MASVKKIVVPVGLLAVVAVGAWYVFAPCEEAPVPATTPEPTENRPAPLSSPLDLSEPPPPINVASSTDAPPPVEVREPAIRGHVRDSRDQPIADAAVTVYNNEKGIYNTFSDSRGVFAVGDLQKAEYRVSALKEHHNEAVEENVPAGRGDVTLILTDMSAAIGRVIDEQGNPVAEFDVVYLKQPPDSEALWKEIVRNERTVWNAFEDADGRFEMADVASSAPFALGARAQGFEPAFVEVPAVEPGQATTSIDIVLRQEGRVFGQVVSPERTPVVGAAVHLGPDLDAPVVARSDVDGRFALAGLGDSPMELTASHDEYMPGSARTVPQRGADVSVEIVLGQGGELTGTVWKGDVPAAGQTVVALRLSPPRIRKQVVTDSEGRYRIAGVGMGLVDVLAKWRGPDVESKSFRLQRQAEIEAGKATVVDFHFASGAATLEGAVTSNGQPVSFAEIHGTVSTEEGQSAFSSTAGEDGSFHIEQLVPGEAWVMVTIRAGQAELRQNFTVELREGETAYQEVKFDTASGISGSISNLSPGEVGQVLALPGHESVDTSTFDSILQLDAIKSGESDIGQNGSFTIEGLEPGPYTLVALIFSGEVDTGTDALDSIRIAVQPITVSPSSTSSVSLTLSP